ncbi:MAG: hypothetical protein HRT89_03675 [Lentisphaeria bacterium]|nr:hypothetical protein [Lentisphaeria bacterium]NQZ67149.1 hypothetical protein [Lentisphaeria bacterium]
MKQRLFLLALLYSFSGFAYMETTRLIKINENGSGFIHLRVLVNSEVVGEGKPIFNQKQLRAAAAQLGSGCTLVAAKEVKRGKGKWYGFIAKYSFSNIRKITIQADEIIDMSKLGGDEEGEEAEEEEEFYDEEEEDEDEGDEDDEDFALEGISWTFHFTQGEVNILKINPNGFVIEQGGEDDFEEDDEDDEELGEDDDTEDFLDKQRGHRNVIYIQMQSEKVDIAKREFIASDEHQNTIILYDEQWDTLATNEKARAILQTSGNRAGLKGLQGFRGISEKIEITFGGEEEDAE